MDRAEIKQIIKQELPTIIREDSEIRQFVLELTRPHYADKAETESRFDRLLAQWQEEREADRRKWEEYKRKWDEERAEDRRKWDEERAEDRRKWEEYNRKWDEERAEDRRKWEEYKRKWDEERAEDKRKWEENNRRWEENNRKFEEFKAETHQRFDKLETDVGILKGDSLEIKSRNNAPAIFGRYLKRGREVVHKVIDQLQEALELGQISEAEYVNVVATDLLWGGKNRATQAELLLVIEISWKVAMQDVARAIERADILRKIGFEALPVVIGREWDEAVRQAKIIRVTNGSIEGDSWEEVMNG